MSTEEAPAQDVSMWPDSRLRPWTIDDALDEKIADENLQLDDRICTEKTGKYCSF